MKTIYRYIIILIVSLSGIGCPAVAEAGALTVKTAEGLAAQADSAYMDQRYSDAVSLYTQALQIDGPNSVLYFNLANSYYRLNKTGYAVANYERALRLDPSNADARANLNFVRSKIENLPTDDSGYLTHLQNRIVSIMSPDGWAWTSGTLTAVFVGLLALYIFSGHVMLRKVGFFGAMIVLALVVYSYLTSYSVATARNQRDQGVVITAGANLNTEPRTPRTASERVVAIPEGAKVKIIDSIATPGDTHTFKWYNVKVNNTTKAWIPAPQVEIL